MNILRDHHGVVDQQPDADHQSKNRGHVQRVAREEHDCHGDEQAQRNRQRNDHRQSELAEEKIENHAGH